MVQDVVVAIRAFLEVHCSAHVAINTSINSTDSAFFLIEGFKSTLRH